MYPTVIDGRTFIICTERDIDDGSSNDSWRAWCFFAFDRLVNIYPADDIPKGAVTQESIAGEFGESEEEARSAVELTLRKVIQTRNLDGTGFYSPPGDFIYPQDLHSPDRSEFDSGS